MATYAERTIARCEARARQREARKAAEREQWEERLAQAAKKKADRERARRAAMQPRDQVLATYPKPERKTPAPKPEHWQGKLRKPRPGAAADADVFRHRGVRLRLDGFLNHEAREICCVFAALVEECQDLAARQNAAPSLFTKQLRQLSPITAVPGASSEQRKADAIAILDNARRWIRGAALENTPLGLYLENYVYHPRNVARAIKSAQALGMAPPKERARGGAPSVSVVGAVRGRIAPRVCNEVGVGEAQKNDRDVRRFRVNRPRGACP